MDKEEMRALKRRAKVFEEIKEKVSPPSLSAMYCPQTHTKGQL